jgi:sugar phosphate isomerase/epimerase
MFDRTDSRPPVAVTLAPLAPDPRHGLEVASTLPVRGVQVSASQPGTRPRDLDRSGRRDLLAAARRRELEIVGIDVWVPSDRLLEGATIDDAVGQLIEAVELAADLGRVAVSTRFPLEGVDDAISTVVAVAGRLGVAVIDHAASGRLIVPGAVEAGAPAPLVTPAVEGLGVGVDPPAWLVAGLDLLEAAGQGIDALRLADLTTDGMRVPPGDADGRVDPATLVAIARTGGFEGCPLIDARRWSHPVEGVRATVGRL